MESNSMHTVPSEVYVCPVELELAQLRVRNNEVVFIIQVEEYFGTV